MLLATSGTPPEVSKLTERAARVPTLEDDLRRLGEDLRGKTADVLRYSGEAAQKGAALEEQAQRIAPLEARLRSTEQQLAQAAYQTQAESYAVIAKRVEENVQELRSLLQQQQQKT